MELGEYLQANKRTHIIGIGGIGTSALAQWLQQDGVLVEGSDAVATPITEQLQKRGISIAIGTPTTFSVVPDSVIYSDAVPTSHPLRQQAASQHIPQYSYAQALGYVTSRYTVIALAGSHGKSTTTALTGLVCEEAGLDPWVIVGSLVPAWQKNGYVGNFRSGKGTICVVEADEYYNHFHHLHPTVAVITSLDHDHVDVFPTPHDYIQSFLTFIQKISPDGTLILEQNVYTTLQPHLTPNHPKIIVYGLETPSVTSDDEGWQIIVHQQTSATQTFSLQTPTAQLGPFSLNVPGKHMILNATAAIAATRAVSAHQVIAAAQKSLSAFTGIWRRFERIGTFLNVPAFSDYAHHPTEVAALLEASQQQFPHNAIVLVLQPHHHERAAAFADQFIEVLQKTMRPQDRLILCPVYGVLGREQGTVVSVDEWAHRLGNHAYAVSQLSELPQVLPSILTPNSVVIFAGAGDIDRYARTIVSS